MDLSKFNTTAACDQSKRFELLDPFTAEPILDEDGETLAFHVVGMKSTVSKNEDARIQREAPKLKEGASEAEKSQHEESLSEYFRKQYARKIAEMITKLEGKWSNGGKELTEKDKGGLSDLIYSQEWLANQIVARANDLKAYRPKI